MGAEFVIYLGHWNVTINPEIDNRIYLYVNNPKAREFIKNRMVSDGLVDVWSLNNPLQWTSPGFRGVLKRELG